MNVYEEDQYPFLKEENTFIQGVLRDEVPFLGICLGSQLLAKACGARVSRSPTEEIGWRTVTLTGEGKNDPLFAGLRPDLFVFQWHGDTFAIPENGQWLVSGPDCPHQALKVGPAAYGFQFHIEITDKSIREWSEEYFKNNPGLLKEKKAEMLAEYEKKKAAFEQEADAIYRILKLIVQGNNSKHAPASLSPRSAIVGDLAGNRGKIIDGLKAVAAQVDLVVFGDGRDRLSSGGLLHKEHFVGTISRR